MRKLLLLAAALCLSACGETSQEPSTSEEASAPASAPSSVEAPFEQYWATAERVDRRTCPSTSCGVVGQLFFRESARVYETKDGWARTTEPYTASCVGGKSEFVDSGPVTCEESNGIVDGKFAEWVQVKDIAKERPPNPADTARPDEKLVADSDDFAKHRTAFAKAAAQLINEGKCTAADFEEQGGFMKSVNTYKSEPVYFIYCGEMTISNRLYLNAETGRVFK